MNEKPGTAPLTVNAKENVAAIAGQITICFLPICGPDWVLERASATGRRVLPLCFELRREACFERCPGVALIYYCFISM